MKKRILSILLMCCMVLTLLPTTVFAEGGAKAIQPGTDGIHGYNTESGYSYIYYGTWRNSPIKWRRSGRTVFADGRMSIPASRRLVCLLYSIQSGE